MNLEKFINVSWYMERKPYEVSSAIDIFYLKICRELFVKIDKVVNKYNKATELDKEASRELAYVFTAYFEDQVSEIGFWKSLIQLHKKEFGKRLPFFDHEILRQQESDYEDILPADIHYLAYITCLNILIRDRQKPIAQFHTPFFIELTEGVFNHLEQIEEIFVNEFYNQYLLPKSDYIAFKPQLSWFTFHSYLTGFEFYRKLDEQVHQIAGSTVDDSEFPALMYAEQDRLMCEVPSSFTAFFPVDILAGAMLCDEKKKQEISKLKLRPHGIFHIQGETSVHYQFLHTSTGEEFNVLKDSFNVPIDSRKQEYWIGTLAQWNNEYYISGLCLPSPYEGEEIYHQNLKLQQNFQKHFAPYRQQLVEIAEKFREKVLQFFGSELVVFDTGYQLQEKLNAFNQWYFKTVADKSRLTKENKPAVFDLPPEVVTAREIALFIAPKDNFQFVPDHWKILDTLQTKERTKITTEDVQQIFSLIGDENVGADYLIYLHRNFRFANLSFLMSCPLDSNADFEALLRIYKPEDFSPLRLPRFSTYTSERISHKTASKIFSKGET